jgi:hypothetical protein
MVGISYYPIKEQWERDHPTKPTARTETPSTTAPPIPIIKKEPPQKPPSQTNNISPKPTIQKEQPIKPKTLQDLFKQDFPSVMKVSQEITFNFNDGTILKIYMNEYADFEGKTKYLGFYIPMSSKSYTICEAILDEYKKLMADIESKSEVTGGHVADSAQTSLHDLIFSGRIFIYHEDNFSLQQLAALERLYQSKGLSVVFRGHAHLLTSWSFRKP